MSPHLLYVAWGYPPSRGSGMYRALATANAFAQEGWDVTVLTATREAFERLTGTDDDAEASIDPRVRVERIPFDTTRGDSDLRRWSRLRVFSPLLWSFVRTLSERRDFPETVYGGWAAPLRAAARRIHAERPVSLVIGTANPNVDFVPGLELARQGVPYVADYRDAWHLDVYSGRRLASRWSRSSRLERRMLSRAREAWFVNPPIRDWHAAEYPANADAFHVLANGYDPAFLTLGDDRPTDAERPLTLGFLGTVYGPMPLRETFEGWRRARARSPRIARSRLVVSGRLGHFATPDPAVLALFDEFVADGVEYTGPVSKTRVSEVYDSFDALLLIVSTGRYVTSGKVYEYAATGLPIASLHDPLTASSAVLRGHPEWFPTATLSPDDIADALIATADRAAVMTVADVAAARAWSAQLSRDAQLQPRIAALRAGLVGEHA
jgi:glycosyltransferase involved in cell wall biosynthesis